MLKLLETSHPTTRLAKPPNGFRSVKGLRWAKVVDTPQFAQTAVKVKGVKAKGLRYERRVQCYLEYSLPKSWTAFPNVWFEFEDARGVRHAQADWLGFDDEAKRICIAEIKLTRVARAWWQLNRLYKPLVQYVFPGWEVCMVEVTTTLRDVAIPEDVVLVSSVVHAKANNTCVIRLPYDC